MMAGRGGVPDQHTSPAVVGLGRVRALAVARLGDRDGAHRGCVDLVVSVVAIAGPSPNPAGFARSPACLAAAVSIEHTRALPWSPAVDDGLAAACADVAASLLADGWRLEPGDAHLWVDATSGWDAGADRWVDDARPVADTGVLGSPLDTRVVRWIAGQPRWRVAAVVLAMIAVANGW